MVLSFLDLVDLVDSLQFIVLEKGLHISCVVVVEFLQTSRILFAQSRRLAIELVLLCVLGHRMLDLRVRVIAKQMSRVSLETLQCILMLL
jgi:hypothetical protein